jgi:hypothetical protein
VSNAVTSLLDNEAMPIPFKLFIKLLLNLTRDVAKVGYVVIFKRPQCCNNSVLYFVIAHVCALNQHSLVSLGTESLKSVGIVAGNDRNSGSIPAGDPEGLDACRRYVYHVISTKIL